MEKISRIVLLLVLSGWSSMAFSEDYNMDVLNQKIAAITEKRLHSIETSIDEANLLSSPEFAKLLKKCTTDWDKIADNFELIDSDQKRQILIWGMGNLTPSDYTSFLEKITAKFETGAILETVIENALSPHGRMQVFIVDNYAHERIKKLLNRIKVKAKTAKFKNSLNEILSGADKTVLNDYRNGHEGLPEGNIPEILLSE